MARPGLAVFSAANLRHNALILRQKARGAKVLAVVKADAYGHGIDQVGQILAPAQQNPLVDGFGVACLAEALRLKAQGTDLPIVLMQGLPDAQQFHKAVQEGLEVTLHHPVHLDWAASLPPQSQGRFWIKVDVGMGRLGFQIADLPNVYEILSRLKVYQNSCKPPVWMGHLACADTPEDPFNQEQIGDFYDSVHFLAGEKSLLNSAGLMAFDQHCLDWVRPGLALYGVAPCSGPWTGNWDLRPVMTVKSRLLSVKVLDKGASVSYGQTYRCPQRMPVGVVAFGYGDGYPAAMRSGAPVWIGGQRCPLIGRVCMDMLVVDLRPCPQAQVGDEVALWGSHLPLEEVAPWSASHAWHMLTGLQARVARQWQD